jgi:hypothetical protein
MMLLDAIAVVALAAAVIFSGAVVFIVASLLRAAPLLATRMGRSRIDVILVRPWRRSWQPRRARSPRPSLAAGLLQPALRSGLKK